MDSDNAVSKFIVVAMPRSRTYWMSKLFDAEHDFIQDEEDITYFFDGEDKGCVSTLPSALNGSERLSEARVAIVDRDPIDVYHSLLKAFPEALEGLEEATKLFVEKEYKELHEIRDSLDAPLFYYEELAEDEIVAELWEWVMPSTPVNLTKIKEFQNTILKMEEV